jgi:hypothetical protein
MGEDASEMRVEEVSSRRLRVFGEEKRTRILGDILGELVKNRFEVRFYMELMFFEGVQNTHQDATGIGACIRNRSEAHLSSDDGRS